MHWYAWRCAELHAFPGDIFPAALGEITAISSTSTSGASVALGVALFNAFDSMDSGLLPSSLHSLCAGLTLCCKDYPPVASISIKTAFLIPSCPTLTLTSPVRTAFTISLIRS